eukprot:2617324-Karenia_brevis.AAC.1
MVKRDPEEFLFKFTYAQWANVAKRAAEAAHIMKLKPVLYMARHSGPSNDVAMRHRSLLEIKARGRWAADSS